MAVAENQDDTAALDMISITGKLEFDCAEMLKARTSSGGGSNPGMAANVDHIWYGHTIATLNLESHPLEYLNVRAGIELRQYMTMLPLMKTVMRDPFFGQTAWMGFYLREGQGIFSLLKSGRASLEMAFGYMPYKYNPEARNLGEFLFRSGTYPLYLLNEFDRPFARLTGLRASFRHGGEKMSANIDLLGLIEREIRPFNDISLALVAGVNVLKIIDVGCGLDMAHVIPVDSRLTTPEEHENEFPIDSVALIDSSTGDPIGFRPMYDYYTFQGAKAMARATVDPLAMLRGKGSFLSDLIGQSGGKVYFEYAVIGFKNYPANQKQIQDYNTRGYKFMEDRSPWMAGFTVPSWKIFDLLAIEVERYPSYSPDNYFRPVINGWPLPTSRNSNPGAYDTSTYVPRWNWSVYAKRNVTRHFRLVGQIGRDHQRWEFHPAQGAYYDFEAAMFKPDEWGWRIAGIFDF